MIEKNEALDRLLGMKKRMIEIQDFFLENPGREIVQEEIDLLETLGTKIQELEGLYKSEDTE